MTRHGIELDTEALRGFCRKWRIREMEVFGSILRDDFGPQSDVDFLVSFGDGVRLTLTETIAMEDELSALIGRPVDVVLHSDLLDPDANPYRKAHILRNRQPVYGKR
jgi:predicted nucleotidyltransferase